MKKKLLITLFIALFTVMAAVTVSAADIWDGTIASGFESGSGTKADPYIIKTPEQLAFLAKSVNSGTKYSGKYIALANDIYLNDTTNWGKSAPKNSWAPIGNSSNHFCGTFDGRGYTVKCLKIDIDEKTAGSGNVICCLGLFGYVNGGTIKNTGVTADFDISITSDQGINMRVGGLVGHGDNGIIENCYVTGDITVTGKAFGQGGGLFSGCIAGGLIGVTRESEIENSYAACTVDIKFITVEAQSENYAGGFVGLNQSVIKNCYAVGIATASATCEDELYSVECYDGGFAGYNDCIISNSYTTEATFVGFNYWTSEDPIIVNCCSLKVAGEIDFETENLTLEEMKNASNFKGFDFATVWAIDKTINSGYPYLQSCKAANKDMENSISLTIGSKAANAFGIWVMNDVAPIVYNDRTMIPARFIAESLGATVGWNAAERKVTITGKHLKTGEAVEINMFIEMKTAYINGEAVRMDTVPFIRDNRTYTPVRFIVEALGATVAWDGTTSTATITR